METKVILDTMWVVFAAVLVFFMNLGFAAVESGLARAKNTVNILSKNFIVFAVSSLGFLVLGWGLMFGDGNGFIGLNGLFMASGADNSPATGAAYIGVYSAISWSTIPFWVKFFFQLVFCGTAATIVSGVHLIYFVFINPDIIYLPHSRPLDLGRRVPCTAGYVGFCRWNCGSFRWRMGCSCWCNNPWTQNRKIHRRWQDSSHSWPQYGPCNDWCLYSVVWLVWF